MSFCKRILAEAMDYMRALLTLLYYLIVAAVIVASAFVICHYFPDDILICLLGIVVLLGVGVVSGMAGARKLGVFPCDSTVL
jgi:hypothetical protein